MRRVLPLGLVLEANQLLPMAALLFKAQLINQDQEVTAELARILFGVDSPEEKEKTFRAICETVYPQLSVREPISISPARSG